VEHLLRGKKVVYLGQIEAADECEALGKGTEKFDTDAARLIAVAAPVIAVG
jgi:hypothetical protein